MSDTLDPLSEVTAKLPEGLCGAVGTKNKYSTLAEGQCVFLETHEGLHSWQK